MGRTLSSDIPRTHGEPFTKLDAPPADGRIIGRRRDQTLAQRVVDFPPSFLRRFLGGARALDGVVRFSLFCRS
tara:strand:- start:287 stop:505 length:219 start_codon:yes stop_codon:yes gene_type:complete